jgi:hypothetical protein
LPRSIFNIGIIACGDSRTVAGLIALAIGMVLATLQVALQYYRVAP